ncbi:hypothetical protein [Calothrix sp. UHCC 0171]|uniref:hypothetical protein n=1 Tax=Calothrix sp. UHCC 0171 TaxID=3110245 RepID=UPI002B2001C4|nr:hypothetical protein [Calothrix sp. UHCC 0171]MEA5574590.1 hypothetical protein [Calothrix sp. UHCC 0171]
MKEQQNFNTLFPDNLISRDEAVELLFGKGTLDNNVQIEEELEVGNIGAGLDWGSTQAKLLLNPGLYWRLKTLRISLNREIRLTIDSWDLGIGEEAAKEVARICIKEKLASPSAEIIPHLEAVLKKDDLYSEEFISNRTVLQSLLELLLTDSEREKIAIAAA